MSEERSPRAWIILPGSGTSEARIRVERQSTGVRVVGAMLILAVAIALMPVLLLVPPHFLWPPVSLAVGGFLAWRFWRGTYSVVSFEGRCPRCDAALDLAAGARIRRRHTLECYGCHRQPELVVEPE